MKILIYGIILCTGVLFLQFGRNNANTDVIDVDKQRSYCDVQVKKTLAEMNGNITLIPRSIDNNTTEWLKTDVYDWTSGFWPGILWFDYEYTNNPQIEKAAALYTESLTALLSASHKGYHDLGFQFYCSFGNAYRLTKKDEYKQILLKGAEKLSKFYNPKVGTMLSWPGMVKQMNWPHNTIMDNMMNLELLFWAAKHGGKKDYYNMAVSYAEKTMENQFRPDGSCYHVAVYDTISGRFLKGTTNQGYSDNSMWARGQAWAIYGFTIVYRETGDPKYLRFVEKVTDLYLSRLPGDYVPYWDFDDPKIPIAPKDASAAAIVASGLLELSQLEDQTQKAETYKKAALCMLQSLSSDRYQSRDINPSFLLHSTGNLPGGYEIDASINYADYYYIEALTRYKEMEKK
ncbi:MAG: glycoside hydrolase family 88 protein [Paraprevotella sp.]|nr:glycoside hydrolase family 88 protein [Paraprevotella sp.]